MSKKPRTSPTISTPIPSRSASARLEPPFANVKLEDRFQFERVDCFCLYPDTTPGKLVFNRTLGLKDSWAKIEKKALLQGADAH